MASILTESKFLIQNKHFKGLYQTLHVINLVKGFGNNEKNYMFHSLCF